MGRKKSSKQADFQKVKLKVGRSLPKGFNVTQTKFKVKKIKIPDQYRPATLEPRTHRHQTVEELLKKAQHTSVSVRHNAFLDMCKLLNSHRELLELHLTELLEVSSIGFRDDAGSVREEATNICCLILENVTEVKIAAVSSVLIPQLCYAMSSINHAIRKDSLKVLELCLRDIPSVITSSEKILKNFVAQISFDKSNPIYDKNGFKVSPMSLKTASERVKSHHWRANVLCTLAKFLKAVIHRFSKKQDEYFWPTFYSAVKIPGLGAKETEFSDLESYFTSLMSVLFDIWIEAAPVPYTKSNSGEIVSAEAAKVMGSVLQAIRLICEWIYIIDERKKNKDMLNWFNAKYRKQIFGRLMVWFPYSQRPPVGRKKQSTNTEMSCLTVNLAICDVFSMMPPTTTNTSSKLYQQVNDYLLHVINRENSGGVASVSIVVKILKNFLASSKLENFEPHLNGLLKRYKELEEEGRERVAFLDFITDLILDIENKEILGNMPMMKHLVQSLLRDLLKMHQNKQVDERTLSVIKQLNVIGFLPLVTELQENSVILIELVKSEEAEIRTTAVYLMSRLTHIPLEYFRELAKSILESAVPVSTVNQLISTLTNGLKHPLHIPAFTGKDYANFLFSLAVGMSRHETDTYMNLAQAEQDKYRDIIPFHFSEYSIAPSNALQYHFEIAQAAIRALMSFSDRKQMAQCIHTYVVQFTTHCASFPVHTAIALLLLECEAYKVGCQPEDMDCLLCITELIIACFLYQDAWERNKEPEEIQSGSIIGALFSIVKVLKNMRDVFELVIQRIPEIRNIEQVHCIIRLFLVSLRKHLVPCEDLTKLIGIMELLREVCGDSAEHEPWWLIMKHELACYAASASNC